MSYLRKTAMTAGVVSFFIYFIVFFIDAQAEPMYMSPVRQESEQSRTGQSGPDQSNTEQSGTEPSRGESQPQPSIRAAFFDNMPPYQFIDSGGGAHGMHIDILEDMAERRGVEVSFLPYRTKEECMEALDKGEADLVLGYPAGSYDSARYQTTGELSKATICMAVRKDSRFGAAENPEISIASRAVFELGTIDYAYMRSMGIKQFMAVGSQMDVARALLEQKADIALAAGESLEYILKERGVQKQYEILYDQISSLSYSILLSADNQRLRALLDMELAELRTSGRYEEIYRSWITSRDLEHARKTITKILIGGGIFAAAALLLIGIIAQINRILREKVEEKTKKLHAANALLEQQVLLLQNERDLRNRIIESVPTGILFLDKAFCVTVMNPAAQNMCGMELDAALGMRVDCLPLFGKLIQALNREVRLPRRQEQKLYLIELPEKEEIRKYRCWFHWQRDISGGILLMAEDVTGEEAERYAAFEKEKAQVLGRLVAGIAHELKNPLMNLKTAVSLILTQGDRQEVKEAFARFIPDEVERMNRLVEGLLNYSRPTREKAEPVKLPELVQSCLYLTQITAKGIQITFTAEPDENSYVRVQKDLLRQSLINILINSIWSVEKKRAAFPGTAETKTAKREVLKNAGMTLEDAEPASAPIRVRVYRDEEDTWVYLSVLDRGIGMEPEALRRCTDPFYTTKKAGTGLGLALTKQFAEDNGGTLTIRSEAGVYTEILLKFRRFETNEENEKQYPDHR